MAEQESITEFPVNSESASAQGAGHWYILHTYSGFEQRVEQMIRELMRTGQDNGCIHDVVVPTERVIELGKETYDHKKVLSRLCHGSHDDDGSFLAYGSEYPQGHWLCGREKSSCTYGSW